jgi:hypothetical protein
VLQVASPPTTGVPPTISIAGKLTEVPPSSLPPPPLIRRLAPPATPLALLRIALRTSNRTQMPPSNNSPGQHVEEEG